MRIKFTQTILYASLPLLIAAVVAATWAPQKFGSADIELQTPSESAIYYEADDVYLLSNFGSGGPTTIDNDGFISRVDAETGEITELEWIKGTLSAPKGMTIVDNTLYVADLDAVEMYDLGNDGAQLGEIPIDTAQVTFPNDVCAGDDGTVYLTDTGLRPDFSSSDTDAVYRIDGGQLTPVAVGADELKGPNGCWVDDGGLLVVTFGSNEILHIGENGDVSQIAVLASGSLDGIVSNGADYYVTSWEGESVFRVNLTSGEITIAAAETPAPAALGLDTERNRLIIPHLQLDQGPPFIVSVVQLSE